MSSKRDRVSAPIAPYGEELEELVYHELHSLFPQKDLRAVNEYLREDKEWMNE